jgi:hypothetical protein
MEAFSGASTASIVPFDDMSLSQPPSKLGEVIIGTILNVGASIDVSDFGLIIIMIGKSLLLCMSHGATSRCVVFWLWTIFSNLNAQNWIRIMLQFIGDDVGASAVGSQVLLLVMLVHYRPTNEVVCQVLFHPGKPSVAAQTKLSFHVEGDC